MHQTYVRAEPFVELFSKDAKLRKGLDAAAKRVGRFADSITSLGLKVFGLGAAGVTGLVALTKSFADAGSTINDLSQRAGISAGLLQEVGFAAEQSGSSMEAVAAAGSKVNKFVGELADGSKEARSAVAQLGLSTEEILKGSPDQRFEQLAQALSRVGDAAKQTQLAQQIFGRGAAELIPLIKGWRSETATARKELRALGAVMSDEDVKAADELGDAWGSLKTSAGGLKNMIGATLAPTFFELSQIVTKSIVAANKWIQKNRAVALTALKIAVGVTVAGAAIIGLGVALSVTAFALSGFSATLAVIGGAIAFVLSPLGLLTAGIIAAGVALVKFSGIGSRAWRFLKKVFAGISADFGAALKSIVKALQAGDIEAAFKVVTATIKVEWTRLIVFLQETWLEWKRWFTREGIVPNLFKTLNAFIADLKEIGINLLPPGMIDKKKALEDLQQQFEENRDKIDQEFGEANAKAFRDNTKKINELLAEVDKAQKELKDAMNAAEVAGKRGGPGAKFPKQEEMLGGLQAAAQRSTAGTFNPAALFGLAGGDVQQKQLTELQRIKQEQIEARKRLRDIQIAIERGHPRWN